ncbi:glycerate kinase family protein [Bacteroides pyogenes]|uniref:glycerate kinase family protein n=1 Tax=Bacteroides pyogenes TaxID=310300 RepID=UPI001BAAB94E|nr:glycerate kinase [Bacteroides pyogenes]MBR8704876.1 Glycerate 2-kinase [Bacteroides pyogenes]
MRKIVLAFDSFKGSVSASDISDSLAVTIRRLCPECEVKSFPIADGGEGTARAIGRYLPVETLSCRVHGPLMEERSASYVVSQDGTAVIEMAAAAGLPLVPMDRRNPMNTTSYGTGELIADALDKGYRKFVIGLGGSATNDAGTGAMRALGLRFLDEAGDELHPIGRNLEKIKQIDFSRLRPDLKEASFVIACDVSNPFYGKEGAAYVYAPQKGASPEEVDLLDRGLRHYAEVLLRETGQDVATLSGAGAAGGMGGGLLPFMDATLKPGIDIVLDLIGFDKEVADADVVLTGEGKIDAQTGMGKALSGVLGRAVAKQVPVVALGGCIEEVEKLNELGFTAVFSIQSSPVSLEKAMRKEIALENLNRTVVQILRLMLRVKS